MKITWLGHSAFRIETSKAKILLDPFLSYNASFSGQDIKDVSAGITHILLTHGHGDHVGDTVALAKETGAVVLANADLAAWLGSKGVDKIEMGNTGGTIALGSFSATFTNALHSSAQITEDGVSHALGNANGLMLHFDDEASILAMGDTDIFSDMALINELHQPISVSCRSATASPWAALWQHLPAGAISTSRPRSPATTAPFRSSTRRPKNSLPAWTDRRRM